jgi:diaminopimelate epimerase
MLTLTKHHGLGNDFLVAIEPPADLDLAIAARALCDRHTGIGADGLIVAVMPDDATGQRVRMVLHNADGGRAELSGNGLRCLGQALVDAGHGDGDGDGRIVVLTDAGEVVVDVGAEERRGLRDVRVGMGAVKVVRLEDRLASVDVGNPHLVLQVDDPPSVDLVALGAQHADVNLEIIRVDDERNVTMRVHERGVGITLACGTGSCAVAAATAAWGLTGTEVVVHNPGGALTVDVGDLDDVWLTGPAQRVAARIEVDMEEVLAAWR